MKSLQSLAEVQTETKAPQKTNERPEKNQKILEEMFKDLNQLNITSIDFKGKA